MHESTPESHPSQHDWIAQWPLLLAGSLLCVERQSSLHPRILQNFSGSAGGFCGRVCMGDNLLKNPHTEPQRFCKTLGALLPFADIQGSGHGDTTKIS